MGIQWDKYHVGLERRHGHIFIGRGEVKGNGKMNWSSRSQDRSGEIIETVAAKMRFDLNNREDDRPWVGYEMPGVGKLVLIKPGYDFEVKRKKRKQ